MDNLEANEPLQRKDAPHQLTPQPALPPSLRAQQKRVQDLEPLGRIFKGSDWLVKMRIEDAPLAPAAKALASQYAGDESRRSIVSKLFELLSPAVLRSEVAMKRLYASVEKVLENHEELGQVEAALDELLAVKYRALGQLNRSYPLDLADKELASATQRVTLSLADKGFRDFKNTLVSLLCCSNTQLVSDGIVFATHSLEAARGMGPEASRQASLLDQAAERSEDETVAREERALLADGYTPVGSIAFHKFLWSQPDPKGAPGHYIYHIGVAVPGVAAREGYIELDVEPFGLEPALLFGILQRIAKSSVSSDLKRLFHIDHPGGLQKMQDRLEALDVKEPNSLLVNDWIGLSSQHTGTVKDRVRACRTLLEDLQGDPNLGELTPDQLEMIFDAAVDFGRGASALYTRLLVSAQFPEQSVPQDVHDVTGEFFDPGIGRLLDRVEAVLGQPITGDNQLRALGIILRKPEYRRCFEQVLRLAERKMGLLEQRTEAVRSNLHGRAVEEDRAVFEQVSDLLSSLGRDLNMPRDLSLALQTKLAELLNVAYPLDQGKFERFGAAVARSELGKSRFDAMLKNARTESPLYEWVAQQMINLLLDVVQEGLESAPDSLDHSVVDGRVPPALAATVNRLWVTLLPVVSQGHDIGGIMSGLNDLLDVNKQLLTDPQVRTHAWYGSGHSQRQEPRGWEDRFGDYESLPAEEKQLLAQGFAPRMGDLLYQRVTWLRKLPKLDDAVFGVDYVDVHEGDYVKTKDGAHIFKDGAVELAFAIPGGSVMQARLPIELQPFLPEEPSLQQAQELLNCLLSAVSISSEETFKSFVAEIITDWESGARFATMVDRHDEDQGVNQNKLRGDKLRVWIRYVQNFRAAANWSVNAGVLSVLRPELKPDFIDDVTDTVADPEYLARLREFLDELAPTELRPERVQEFYSGLSEFDLADDSAAN